MDEARKGFNSLAPELLNENEQIYTEALDYAFGNNDIKNVAITGIYGAGKSTVWKRYVKYKKLENYITVSLGKYEDDINDGVSNENEQNIKDESRIERQLINQMLSQIKSEKILLSKYKFNRNFSHKDIIFRLVLTVCFISSILVWLLRESIYELLKNSIKDFSSDKLLYVCGPLFLLPMVIFLYLFYRENRVKISRINLQGAEAEFKDGNDDETVLDRDIKEIVYLLSSSGVEFVIFEDLDRYDSINIFTKLRELNFLLNSYVKTNGDGRIIRFVYMLKDGLFFSKSRTKFFDFILPIVPVVDSKTSEDKVITLLKNVDNPPDKNIVSKISLYIDDMRLLKNIVNEYIVYSKVIPIGKIDLDKNKLFSLITLKNLFPNEFDLLQEDKGYIRTVFDNIEAMRPEIVSNLNLQIQKLQERIVFLNDRIESNKFEAMALMLPTNVCLDNQDGKTWGEKLKEWSVNKDKKEYIRYNQLNGYSFNYEEFVERYIATTEHNKYIITELTEDKKSTLDILNSNIQMIKNKIKKIEIFSVKELLSYMTLEQREKVFLENKNIPTESHYSSIIRFLIVEGLLDETYWYYKGNFNVDISETLKRNDRIYMKGLLEGKELDVYLDVETPTEIIERLSIYDFGRFNILNKNIFKSCLDRGLKNHVRAITDSAKNNDNYKDLVTIIDDFDLEVIEQYVDILLEEDENQLSNIIKLCITERALNAINNILISIVINEQITPDKIEVFRVYIEKIKTIISLIPEEKFNIFINNIKSSHIKFNNLKTHESDIERLKEIENIKAYKLNLQNVLYIAEKILEKNINYGYLISEICKSEILKSTKEYIDNNFEDFINEYIDNTIDDVTYTNDEDILIQILLSDIDQEKKLDYIIHNETIIRNICAYEEFSELDPNSKEDCEIFMNLFSTDKIEFNEDNINIYLGTFWNIDDKPDQLFADYVYRNIDNENIDDIFCNNKNICNSLITSPFVEDRLFDLVLNYADRKIINARKALSKERISKLIKKDLLEITDHNIEVLIDNSYYEELVLLVNSKDQNIENDVITKLISYEITVELVYMLINSNISTSNAIKLTNYIGEVILLKKIDLNKTGVIKNIINNGLSEDNIKFICENFDTFKLKDDFIECLEFNGKLEEMNNVYLNDIVMSYILEYKNITADIKISLIIIKIRNNIDACELKRYISYVTEISNIANLWDNNFPSLDNVYQEKIVQALIENKYAKKRKDGKLMVIKPNR